jgi:hypothetical protein
MGSEQSHARGTSVAINDMEIVQYNENDLNVTFFTYTETFK